jgi:acyl-CoA synthetase (AMP-forming)/AMP-acid ligase II
MGAELIRSSASTVYEVVRDVALASPDADAIVHGDCRISYGEFRALVDRTADALGAWGVRKGDRVAILSTPRPEVLVLIAAAAKLGAIYLGLGTRLMRSDLEYVVNDAQPVVVLGLAQANGRTHDEDLQAACAGKVPHLLVLRPPGDGLSPEFLQWIASADAMSAESLPQVDGADPFAVIYTSGTTGAPKGAVVSHQGVITSVSAILRRMDIRELRAVSVLPIDHVGFLSSDAVRVFVSGGCAVQLPRFDPGLVCRAIERHRATSWTAIPTMLQRLTECREFSACDLSSIQVLWWAGPMPQRIYVRLREKWPTQLAVAYGMTEASGGITFSTPRAGEDELLGSAGSPLDAIEVRVVPGADGDDVGEIQLRGPQLMLGYWKRPDATSAAFTADGWFRTGDLGAFHGNNLQICGRSKELIRSGGYNVSPNEVETEILKHPGVAWAVVFGRADDTYGEAVHAVWVPAPGSGTTESELARWLRGRLSGFKVPKRFWQAASLPFLPNGKLDRKAVADKYRSLAADTPVT